MHSEHDIFAKGVEQRRRLKVTVLGNERRRNVAGQCAPLYYSRGKVEGDGLDCYYLWNFEADEGYNFMALSPSQIISMELTEIAFSLDELDSPGKPAGNATKGPGTVSNT
ncbi:MAG: hypothetical protein ACYSWW_09245 [Planctomycetota bacterium]